MQHKKIILLLDIGKGFHWEICFISLTSRTQFNVSCCIYIATQTVHTVEKQPICTVPLVCGDDVPFSWTSLDSSGTVPPGSFQKLSRGIPKWLGYNMSLNDFQCTYTKSCIGIFFGILRWSYAIRAFSFFLLMWRVDFRFTFEWAFRYILFKNEGP